MPEAVMSNPYVGHCVHCGQLAELDTSTALCLDEKKCAEAAEKVSQTKRKKAHNGG